MKKRFKFTIYGEPMGKGRPRFSTFGGRPQTYTPEKTANYEQLVKLSFLDQCGGNCKVEDDAQLYVEITAYFSVPKRDSKKMAACKHAGIIRPTKKPDCDNITKIVLDSLNKIAYSDDAQVVGCDTEKYYVRSESESARVEVTIYEIE